MKYQIKSILEEISSKVFSMKNLDDAKKFIIVFVETKGINEKDKKSLLTETANAKSLTRLQTYLCNALLKYEGLGMAQLNKTDKEQLSTPE